MDLYRTYIDLRNQEQPEAEAFGSRDEFATMSDMLDSYMKDPEKMEVNKKSATSKSGTTWRKVIYYMETDNKSLIFSSTGSARGLRGCLSFHLLL